MSRMEPDRRYAVGGVRIALNEGGKGAIAARRSVNIGLSGGKEAKRQKGKSQSRSDRNFVTTRRLPFRFFFLHLTVHTKHELQTRCDSIALVRTAIQGSRSFGSSSPETTDHPLLTSR